MKSLTRAKQCRLFLLTEDASNSEVGEAPRISAFSNA